MPYLSRGRLAFVIYQDNFVIHFQPTRRKRIISISCITTIYQSYQQSYEGASLQGKRWSSLMVSGCKGRRWRCDICYMLKIGFVHFVNVFWKIEQSRDSMSDDYSKWQAKLLPKLKPYLILCMGFLLVRKCKKN